MLLRKNLEFYVEIYDSDLKIPLDKCLNNKTDVKEFIYTHHDDASKPHYHIYLSFDSKIKKADIKKIFCGSQCFITEMPKGETVLSTFFYFTNGFRLDFVTNYNVRTDKKTRD